MARVLIVGCGCRGRMLAEALQLDGHTVRGTTRTESGLDAIAASGAEPVVADPDRLGTVMQALPGVSVVCWLLGSAEAAAELHGDRLQTFVERLVDTPVRGFVYEAAGTVDDDAARERCGHRPRGLAPRGASRWRSSTSIPRARRSGSRRCARLSRACWCPRQRRRGRARALPRRADPGDHHRVRADGELRGRRREVVGESVGDQRERRGGRSGGAGGSAGAPWSTPASNPSVACTRRRSCSTQRGQLRRWTSSSPPSRWPRSPSSRSEISRSARSHQPLPGSAVSVLRSAFRPAARTPARVSSSTSISAATSARGRPTTTAASACTVGSPASGSVAPPARPPWRDRRVQSGARVPGEAARAPSKEHNRPG